MKVRAFKFSITAREVKPNTEYTCLLESYGDCSLTRSEKNKIADITRCAGHYKLLGWEWPMWMVLPRFLVSMNYEPDIFRTYYAPDKTSLRYFLRSGVKEIIAAPKKRIK